MNPDVSPQMLQDKVQFDIRFYFVRCANENVDKFTKKTFILELDPNTGIRYIRKNIDELTKNHQELDSEMVNAAMPEQPNSDRCPVKNFMTYLSKLHPRCDFLWQHSKKVEDIKDSDVWYRPSKIGPNPLSTFMSRISHEADLSKVYTNHSIRSTATTFLGRANFSPKQIMSVTGHRSLNSLAVYQKVSQNEKIAMGIAMNLYLQSDHQPAIQNASALRPIALKQNPPPAALGAPPPVKMSEKNKEIVAYEPEDPLLQEDFNQELDFDVQAVLNDIEKENVSMTQVQTTNATSMTLQRQKSPNIPIFSGCKIENINNLHIHIHKN